MIVSKTASISRGPRVKLPVSIATLFLLMILESLSVYPHSLSFFNCAVGGPRQGPRYLLDSNIDWGQDLHFLNDWRRAHPDAAPLHVCIPYGMTDSPLWAPPYEELEHSRGGLRAGWYALSVNEVYGQSDPCRQFANREPDAMAGYSVYIYHIEDM